WVLKRYVDPRAEFFFIEPFTHAKFGTPFDLPEAQFRRTGTRSTTELLLAKRELSGDPRLTEIGAMTHLFEITPWLLPSNPAAFQFGRELKLTILEEEKVSTAHALEKCFELLERFAGRVG